MSSSTPEPEAGATQPTASTVSLSLGREQLPLLAIVVGQAVWLSVVMLPGWYSSADLPNLAFANGRDLDWDYLSSDLGGHFGAAQRLVYWLLNRAAPLEWWLTVLLRVAVQALTTVLLWRLLRSLVGPRPWLWIVLAGYAFSAYLVPGMAALNSGLGLSIAQACVVGALLAQVRYTRQPSLRDAALVAVLVFVALAFAQQSLPLLVFLPLLSFVFLQQGSLGERVRGVLQLWPSWVALAAGMALFLFFYVTGDYNSPSSEFTFGDARWLVGQAWLKVLGPALLGGPWHFDAFPSQWSAYAGPPTVLVVLGQIALVALIIASIRRNGWLALVAWMMPVWTAVTCLVLVGAGRWAAIGEWLPAVLRYSYFVPLSLALGVALAFAGRQTIIPNGARVAAVPTSGPSPRSIVVVVASVALVASSLYSASRFAERFWENPSRKYVANALRDINQHGEDVQLFNALLPESIVPFVSQMYVDDLVTLGGASADFDGPSNGRVMVGDQGRLVLPKFVTVANLRGPREKGCGIHVRGAGTERIALTRVSGPKEWYLQLETYQPHDAQVSMRVIGTDGKPIPLTVGSTDLDLTGELTVLHRSLDTGVPAVIELTATDPDTNFCLVHARVGIPFP